MFKGSITALVTPFRNDRVDEKTFRKLIEYQIEHGADGILPCGCTGEAATLTMDEQKRLIKIAVETSSGRVPVLAGTGSNSTQEAVELTSYARKAGSDAALLITPYYNKPTAEGQYRHYAEVASSVDIPIVLYNVPSRTGISLSPDTVARLAEIDNIVGIKEAGGSSKQVMDILSAADITVLSGDDTMTLPFMSLGASGVVSVVANIIPRRMHQLVQSWLDGKHDECRKIHYEVLDLCRAMFLETNPGPVKTALGMMGMIQEEWRMPMCPIQLENRARLKKVLQRYQLI